MMFKWIAIAVLMTSCNLVKDRKPANSGNELSRSSGGVEQSGVRAISSPFNHRLPGIGTQFNAQCRNFIQSDGSYGPWGVQMIEAMRRVEQVNGTNCFFGTDPSSTVRMGQRCRSSESFAARPTAEKEHIWIWLWAAIAQAESSCSPSTRVNGIWNDRFQRYNIADGLFQLEYNSSTRAANARDPRFCPHTGANSQSLEFQFECAASIMHDRQCGGFVKDGNSYWQKLRLNGGQIWNLFSTHPEC